MVDITISYVFLMTLLSKYRNEVTVILKSLCNESKAITSIIPFYII